MAALKPLRPISLCLLLLVAAGVTAQLRLGAMYTDGMVLQQGKVISVPGNTRPGTTVQVIWKGRRYAATAGKDGKFLLKLPPAKAGGPYTLEVVGEQRLTLTDIWVGEVWLCAGQSNMVLTMDRVKEKFPDEIRAANYPKIRFYTVTQQASTVQPSADLLQSRWSVVDTNSVLSLSATAFFFARRLQQQQQVPVGIVIAAVGGTPIASWMSESALQAFPDLVQLAEKNKDTAALNKKISDIRLQQQQLEATFRQRDPGLTADTPWYAINYCAAHWGSTRIPGFWDAPGNPDTNGVYWFKKTILLSAAQAALATKLYLGRLVDADETWINGELVGTTGYQYPPRRYALRKNLLHEGENTITVRLTNYQGRGGFATGKRYYLRSGEDSIDLAGEWQQQLAIQFTPQDVLPPTLSLQNQPAALFNGMIAPLAAYAIKGICWYQGESNTGRPGNYAALLAALVRDWRRHWSADLPFAYVQLPNFQNDPPDTAFGWPQLREAQRQVLETPNTAMAITIDAGERNDLHPLDKKTVGERLYLAAAKLAYGGSGLYTGALVRSFTKKTNGIELLFSQAEGGLHTTDNQPPSGFEAAGVDKVFRPVAASIQGQRIFLPVGKDTRYIRYAWRDQPEVNLVNAINIPASPFQIDCP